MYILYLFIVYVMWIYVYFVFVVLSVGEDGMWEGKTGDKEGWFPPDNVSEQQKRHTIGES